jgi:hypothetical protein
VAFACKGKTSRPLISRLDACRFSPNPSGHISLSACATGGALYLYAHGPAAGYARFNATVRAGARCAPALELEPGPVTLGDVEAWGLGGVAVAGLGLAALAACALKAKRAQYQSIS